jgi:type IV secretion system protein VirB9
MDRLPTHARALVTSLILACALMVGAAAAQPITTDSRIKTLVFNPNEVFNLTTHYGYQSNIEFGAKETIETISVGDRTAWQISPAGQRLFIRAMEENAHTNMTVVTNLRAYQFDLRSSSADAVFGSAELTYVVRFFYPDETSVARVASYSPVAAPALSVAVPTAAATNASPEPLSGPSPYNYRYTFTGPATIAPVKIYDDGRMTFFKFPATSAPQIAVITAKGETLDVPITKLGDGVVSVNAVAPRFSIRQGADQVVVYNEANGVM